MRVPLKSSKPSSILGRGVGCCYLKTLKDCRLDKLRTPVYILRSLLLFSGNGLKWT